MHRLRPRLLGAEQRRWVGLFIIMIVGFIVVGLALMLEVMFTPPVWLHMILWLPLSLGLAFAMMRPAKGILIALQYRYEVHFESDRDSS